MMFIIMAMCLGPFSMYKRYIYNSAELGVTSLSFQYQKVNDKKIHVEFVPLPTNETQSKQHSYLMYCANNSE